MTPVKQLATSTVAAALRNQPLSPAKVRFAWELAAGRPMARAAEPAVDSAGTVVLRVTDARWAREIARAQPILLERLRAWLGPDVQVRVDLPGP